MSEGIGFSPALGLARVFLRESGRGLQGLLEGLAGRVRGLGVCLLGPGGEKYVVVGDGPEVPPRLVARLRRRRPGLFYYPVGAGELVAVKPAAGPFLLAQLPTRLPPDERSLVEFALAAAASFAAQTLLFQPPKEDRVSEKLVGRILREVERERRELVAALHDGAVQRMVGAAHLLDLELSSSQPSPRVARAREAILEAARELRGLLQGLRPSALDERGLLPALQGRVNLLQEKGFLVRFTSRLGSRLPRDLEDVLFRIGQEALENVERHSGARRVRVGLGRFGQHVELVVADDGRGFDPSRVPQGHLGLSLMREWAEAAGGWLRVWSRPGEGTVVRARLPLKEGREGSWATG